MKVLLLCIFSLSSLIGYAKFPVIDIQNISGNYVDGKGNAYAPKAYYVLPKVKISHSDINIKINKKDRSLVISDPNTMVELDFDFSALNVFKVIEFNNLNIKSNHKIFTVSSETLDWFITPKNYHITDMIFETDVRNIPTQDDEDISVVDGIILNAKFHAKKMEFNKFSPSFFEGLKIENPNQISEIEKLSSKSIKTTIPMIVRSIHFNAKEGAFSGKAKIDSYINLWLRLSGNVTTDKTNSYLDIHLRMAKLGIFSIRRTLLSLVRRLKMDNVKVNGSHIIIDLNAIVLGGGASK